MLTLYVHSAETMSIYVLKYIIYSFTRRESCGFVTSILLVLLGCCNPNRISIHLEQTQGSMRPVLRWNQARGRLFHYLPGWVSNTDHYITGGLQSTEQMVALILNRS